MINLEYRTGAAPPDPQYNSLMPEHSGSFLTTNEFVNNKRSYNSAGGPGYLDNTHNQIREITLRQEYIHQDSSFRGEPATEALQLPASAHSQLGSMNATEVHKDLILAYDLWRLLFYQVTDFFEGIMS